MDQNTLELKGRENGETVRITYNNEVTTYSSDMPGHALHRHFSEPETCPNEYTPAWYDEFLQANAKPTFPKAGVGLKKGPKYTRKAEIPGIFPSAL